MKLYTVSYDSHGPNSWTWAWKIRPYPNANSSLCDLCGKGRFRLKNYPKHPLTTEVEGGRAFPDVLGCSYPLLAVSEHVLEDWQNNNITGGAAYPLTIAKAQGKRISTIPAPQYYHTFVTGRCELDFEAMGIRITFLCPKCGYYEKESIRPKKIFEDDDPFDTSFLVIKANTWDGSDLFTTSWFSHTIFCSQRVVDLASINRHTNFMFQLPENYGKGKAYNIPYMNNQK